MIVGGACRGWGRAGKHAGLYAKAYSLGGFPIVLLMGTILGDTEYGNFWFVFVIVHFLSLLVVWPAAIFANFAALRLFRPRSWRHEPWRGWVAGILGVPFTWSGFYVWPYVSSTRPDFLKSLDQNLAELLLGIGVMILFSNLAVLVGWILPSWKKSASPHIMES